MNQLDLIAVLTVAVPVLVAFITAWFSYAAGRAKARVDATTSVNSGFQILITKLQEERVELTKVVDRQNDIMEEQSGKISALEAQVRQLIRHIDRLERVLSHNGLEIPNEPNG